MSSPFEEYYEKLHLEVNDHLSSLHVLHHKQQILNIQMVATQVMSGLGDQCQNLVERIQDLIDTITEGLVNDNLGIIIKELSDFLVGEDDKCMTQIQGLVIQLETYLNLINKESTSFKEHIQFSDLSNLDTTEIYQQIIDPLSNLKRVDILMVIHNSKKRFKDLETELNLQGGHLIYHLNPLKEAKYVMQDAQKNYILTDKGNTILEAIKHIYETYPQD